MFDGSFKRSVRKASEFDAYLGDQLLTNWNQTLLEVRDAAACMVGMSHADLYRG